MLRIGYHVSIQGRIDLAFDRADEIGCTAMQVFLSNPRGWGVKELGEEEISAFISKSESLGIEPVLAHMPYLPNIASPNDFAYRKSIEALKFAAGRCGTLGIKYLVMHLGSDLGHGKKVGFARALGAIKSCKKELGNVTLLLENEAGQANSIGSTLEDLVALRGQMLEVLGDEKVGFCLDTCHVFEAGYDIRKEETVSEIFKTLGKDNVRAIHLNDARYELGRALDRHENIGMGFIGRQGFSTFLNSVGAKGKPLIMETPMRSGETDIDEIRLVRSLIKKDSD
jgi:deoxyribonuclease-4